MPFPTLDALVGKNAELAEDQKGRKLKGRVVFDGSDAVDQDRNIALFLDLSSCPATMQAGQAACTYCLYPGQSIQQSDARQALAQFELGGVPAWVRLPRAGPRAPSSTGAARSP